MKNVINLCIFEFEKKISRICIHTWYVVFDIALVSLGWISMLSGTTSSVIRLRRPTEIKQTGANTHYITIIIY